MPFEALSAKARLMVPVGRSTAGGCCACRRRGSRRGCPRAAAARHPGSEVLLGVEQREGALLAREADAGAVGDVAHRPRQVGRHRPRLGAVVAQAEQDQRVAEPGEAEPDPALGGGLPRLLRQRPDRRGQHVVEHPHRHRHGVGEGLDFEARLRPERVAHEAGQADRAEAAAAVVGDRDLAAGVRRLDALGIMRLFSALIRSRNSTPGSAAS